MLENQVVNLRKTNQHFEKKIGENHEYSWELREKHEKLE